MLKDFLGRFWRPPRAHGDVIDDRTVSFLELFYSVETCPEPGEWMTGQGVG